MKLSGALKQILQSLWVTILFLFFFGLIIHYYTDYQREKQVLSSLASSIVVGQVNHIAKVQKILGFVHENVKYSKAWGGFLRASPLEILEHQSNGGGSCGQYVRVAVALLNALGYEAHRVYLHPKSDFKSAGDANVSNHVVAEVKIGGKWIIIDPLYNILFLTNEGNGISFQDLQTKPYILKYIKQNLSGYTTQLLDKNGALVRIPYHYVESLPNYQKFHFRKIPLIGPLTYSVLHLLIGQRVRDIATPIWTEFPSCVYSYAYGFLAIFTALLGVVIHRRRVRLLILRFSTKSFDRN